MAGSIVEPSYDGGRAGVRWIGAQVAEVLKGPRTPGGGPLTMLVVDGKVVRDDGHVYGTCIQAGAYGEPLACLYAAPGEVQIFGLGHVFAADAFDNVAGTRQAERHAPFQSFATYDSQTLPYPDLVSCSPSRGGCEAAARDFTTDGALIVGSAHIPSESAGPTPGPMFDTAFIHDAARGARSLPDLPGGERASGAYAITPDGRVVVGFASDTDGRQAVLWIEEEPVLLKDLSSQAGGELPAGFSLSEVRAVSSDGRTFAGNGINARKQSGGVPARATEGAVTRGPGLAHGRATPAVYLWAAGTHPAAAVVSSGHGSEVSQSPRAEGSARVSARRERVHSAR